MNKPQLYNVLLSNYPKDNPEFMSAVANAYCISKEDTDRLIKEISERKQITIICAPLDIAKTLSDRFLEICRRNAYLAKIDLQLSGKYDA